MKVLARLRYSSWWLFGGRRTEAGFRVLARSVEGNRKLISDLRRRVADLELRLWDLEDHTVDETMMMLVGKLKEFQRAVKAAGGKSNEPARP